MKPSSEFLPFARPSFDAEEEAAVIDVLRSGWLTTGAQALAFEGEFAAFVGVQRALAVNSATSGLHLALEALGVGPGTSVVVPSYTFAATANVARQLGAEVRFCDSSPRSPCMDGGGLERALAGIGADSEVRAVIPVHVAGQPCGMEDILSVARARGISVLEDAAHSFPSKTKSGYAGTIGDIGVYSFYATKTITTGEGGMIVARDAALLDRMSAMRSHGIDRAVWNRYTSDKASWYYEVRDPGFKYNLPDILAAIGRVQLRKAQRFQSRREEIARAYDQAFTRCDALELPYRDEGHSWHLYQLFIRRGERALSRDDVITRLKEAGIGSSVHFIPLHLMPYYAHRYSLAPEDFPNALDRFQRTVSLPIYPSMTDGDVGRVIDAVLDLFGIRA